MMQQDLSHISNWFNDRPYWLQVAALKLLNSERITDDDFSDLVRLCKDEAKKGKKEKGAKIDFSVLDDHVPKTVRLNSISSVRGINALAPRKPLEFGKDNLSIIYGLNGSGKSGYIRILKHICGAKQAGILLGDVFKEEVQDQRCDVGYSLEKETGNIIQWNPQLGIVDDLRNIDIYDAKCGQLYVDEENTVTYEPFILKLFSELIKISDRVSHKLNFERNLLAAQLPAFPQKIDSVDNRQWYEKLTYLTKSDDVEKRCKWEDKDQAEFDDLLKRLSETSPGQKSKDISVKNEQLLQLLTCIKNNYRSLSNKKCKKILNIKQDSKVKREAAETFAKENLKLALLDGVGSQTWKHLWEHARKYSELEAYKEEKFPNIDGLCVLCHQRLSPKAGQRLDSFEKYIKSSLQQEATEYEDRFKGYLYSIGDLPSRDELKTRFSASGLSDNNIQERIFDLYNKLEKRKMHLISANSFETIPEIPKGQQLGFIKKLLKSIKEREIESEKYKEDANNDNREELLSKFYSLKARQWFSENKYSIEDEIKRLIDIHDYKKALSLTNTSALSKKKDKLAENLVTKEFIKRFKQELIDLTATEIKVELIKTHTEKGHVLHKLQLQDLKKETNPNDILSEGELRIISLSAFLADVTGKPDKSTFIFDDPISSLDDDYAESVAERLVKLSTDRQVIVFTHRLLLLGLLNEYSEKENVKTNVLHISKEPWGSGEPGDTPLLAKKPDKALNKLIDERLAQAENIYNSEGSDAYYILAQSICVDVRILIERIVETILLARIIQRHIREVQTKGKLHSLLKINQADCNLIDNIMTKYSKYKHSQSEEHPILPPKPKELRGDLELLKNWCKEFSGRAIAAERDT